MKGLLDEDQMLLMRMCTRQILEPPATSLKARLAKVLVKHISLRSIQATVDANFVVDVS